MHFVAVLCIMGYFINSCCSCHLEKYQVSGIKTPSKSCLIVPTQAILTCNLLTMHQNQVPTTVRPFYFSICYCSLLSHLLPFLFSAIWLIQLSKQDDIYEGHGVKQKGMGEDGLWHLSNR